VSPKANLWRHDRIYCLLIVFSTFKKPLILFSIAGLAIEYYTLESCSISSLSTVFKLIGGIWLFTGILYIFTGIGYCCENGWCNSNCCNEVNGPIKWVTLFAEAGVQIWASWKVFGKSLHLLILWCRAGGRSNVVVIICLILTPWLNRVNWCGKIWGANWAGLAVLQSPSWQSGYFKLTDR
jgi:hypothetical protein